MNYELGHIFTYFVMKNIIYICVDRVDLNVELFRRCEGLVFDDLPSRKARWVIVRGCTPVTLVRKT